MSSFKVRPRFKHAIKAKQEEVESMIVKGLEQEKAFTFHHIPGHLNVKVHPEEQHFWSPQLSLSFEQQEEEVIIRGLYGPNPTLWAVFFFGYVVIGLVSLFVGMWGLAKWMLGHNYAVLWLLPVMGILALGLYISAQTGQKLGAQQMFDIHHFYESMTGDKVEVE